MFQQNNITPGIGELIKGPQQSQAQTPSPLESEDHHIVREQHRLDREERAKITLWKKPITTLAYFVLETWVILVGWCHRWDEVWDHRPVCFNFERAGAPRHFLLGKGHPMKKFLLGKHLRALRQWSIRPGISGLFELKLFVQKYLHNQSILQDYFTCNWHLCMKSLHNLLIVQEWSARYADQAGIICAICWSFRILTKFKPVENPDINSYYVWVVFDLGINSVLAERSTLWSSLDPNSDVKRSVWVLRLRIGSCTLDRWRIINALLLLISLFFSPWVTCQCWNY